MNRSRLLHGIRVPLLAGFIFTAALAGTRAAETPRPVVDAPAQDDAGQPILLTPLGDTVVGSMATYDFGTISQGRTEPLVHDFLLRNTGKSSVTIDRVQPQCGCTTAVLQAGNGNTVAAGQTVKIHISVDPGHLIPGEARKNVLVFLQGQPQPAATLVMAGNMQALASFSPSLINFGDVRVRESRAAVLTVTYDRSLLKGGKLPEPKLARELPGIKLEPASGPDDAGGIAAPAAVPAPPDVDLTPAPMGPDTVKKYYRVVVTPDARIGNTFVTVSLAGTNRAESFSAFTSIMVNIIGDIQASPNSLAFGTVGQGTTQTVRFAILGKPAANTRDLKVATDNAHVTARYIPATANTTVALTAPGMPAMPSQLGTVEVSLKPDAPAGSLQAKVVVTAADGQALEVPVWAYIPTMAR
jgi:hypothetical protein